MAWRSRARHSWPCIRWGGSSHASCCAPAPGSRKRSSTATCTTYRPAPRWVTMWPVRSGTWRLVGCKPRIRLTRRKRQPSRPGSVSCPRCGRPPASLVICRHDHCGCGACSSRCSVCEEDFCADHGIARCRVDEQPACEGHARVCQSCRMAHCSVHEGACAEGGHMACSECLAACGSCGRIVCNRHAEQSHADAPKGSRRLCSECLRYCEGGTNEPVGVDEVTQCASCGNSVCTAHQAVCAVDGQVHCSQHLRRTDQS